MALEFLWKPHVVRIQERDVLASCLIDPCVSRHARPAVCLSDEANARIGRSHPPQILTAAVVNDDSVPVFQRLSHRRRERGIDVRAGVVRWDDHADTAHELKLRVPRSERESTWNHRTSRGPTAHRRTPLCRLNRIPHPSGRGDGGRGQHAGHKLTIRMKLSFLVPAYNAEDVLDDAVASALRQRPGMRVEIVVVDDGSTDATGPKASAWAERHPETVRFARHEYNKGGGAARNTAAAMSTGELIYMLDADNVLPAGTVAQQLRALRESGADAAAVGQVYYFDGQSSEDIVDGWVQRHSDGRCTIGHIFETPRVPPSHGNYLYTRRLFNAVGGYPEDAGATDTWVFGLRHLSRGFDIAIAPTARYLHRRAQPGGRSSYWMRELRNADENAIRAMAQRRNGSPHTCAKLLIRFAPPIRSSSCSQRAPSEVTLQRSSGFGQGGSGARGEGGVFARCTCSFSGPHVQRSQEDTPLLDPSLLPVTSSYVRVGGLCHDVLMETSSSV